MRIESTGSDPWLRTSAFPRVTGEVTVEIRMRSRVAGAGAVYAATKKSPGFHRDRMKGFSIQHDGQWHTYRIDVTLDSQLTVLRIDPGNAQGTIEIDRIRLIGWRSEGAGRVARDWRF